LLWYPDAACHVAASCRHPLYVVYASVVVSVLHVLSFLFTHWIVSFNALVNYKRVDKLNDAEYIQVSLQDSPKQHGWVGN
jgi:hypothetical protein